MDTQKVEALWMHLHWLNVLAAQGSYTAAAARLGVSKAAMSQRIAELERVQRLIEENNFVDPVLHSGLDVQFHTVVYQRHYNRHAAEIWWKHREVLRSVSQRFHYTLARRAQVIREHRELIALIKAGEADKAAQCIAQHVEGSGRHLLEQMRAYDAARAS